MTRMVLEFVLDSKGNLKAFTDAGKEIEGVGKKSKTAGSSISDFGTLIKTAAGALVIFKTAQAAIDFAKLGGQVQAVRGRFEKFAGGADQAAEYLDAMTRASEGTLDKMAAMAGASKMLQMGIATNTEELEFMAAAAIKLGDQTTDASMRMADWNAMIANQSIPRLDNFGISSGRVRTRIKELQAATKDMSREEAFKIAVMEEGRKSLKILGDTTESVATKTAIMEAKWKDTKNAAASLWANLMVGSGTLDAINEAMTELAENAEAVEKTGKAAHQAIIIPPGNIKAREKLVETYWEQYRAQIAIERGAQQNAWALKQVRTETEDLTEQTVAASYGTKDATYELDVYAQVVKATTEYEENLQATKDRLISRLEEQRLAQIANKAALMDFAMVLTGYYQDTEKNAESFAQRREQIEEEHQESLAAIQKRGQARLVKVDIEAEQQKLETLQTRLAIALQQQAEFTDKTKESTRMAKDAQIATLQGQIAEQTELLNSANEGYLTMQGEYIGKDLEAENARYAEKKRLLDEAIAAEEEAQTQAYGRMLLQQFDYWAQRNEIEPGKAQELRNKLAVQYGLMTQKQADEAAAWQRIWGQYAGSATMSADQVVAAGERAKNAINALPTERTIKIRIEEEVTKYESGPSVRYQAGGYVRGGMALVGEMGPELVSLPRGSYVHKASDTRGLMSAGRGGIGGGGEVHVHLHMHGGTVVGHAAMRDLALEVGRELEGQKLLAGASRSFEV